MNLDICGANGDAGQDVQAKNIARECTTERLPIPSVLFAFVDFRKIMSDISFFFISQSKQ